jgi:hypothetical protein
MRKWLGTMSRSVKSTERCLFIPCLRPIEAGRGGMSPVLSLVLAAMVRSRVEFPTAFVAELSAIGVCAGLANRQTAVGGHSSLGLSGPSFQQAARCLPPG